MNPTQLELTESAPDGTPVPWSALTSTVSKSGPYGTTFGRLVREIERLTLRFARGDADGQDWAQKIAMYIFDKRIADEPRYLENPAAVYGYVRSAVHRLRISRHRKREAGDQRDEAYTLMVDAPRLSAMHPETELEESLLTRIGRDAIAELPEPQRSIYLRVRLGELSYEQAAAEFGKPKWFIKNAIALANGHLHQRIDPHVPPGNPRGKGGRS